MKRTLQVMMVMFISLSVFAQDGAVTGKVTAESGEGLPGVNVVLKGTTVGSITDAEGNYRITANDGILVFSFIGYTAQEVPVEGRSVIDIVMAEDVKTLEQVVVVGYGTQRRKDLTTSVVTVSQEDFKDRPIVSATEGLQGKAAGVQVIQPSGKPGGDISVRVRGSTSVQAGNEPLYVIDGVPTTDIRGLNANDIETMSVLKDASSASIYGARAANGVVLITTKRGKSDVPVLQFNAYAGFSKIGKQIDVLNTEQYANLMEDVLGSGSVTSTNYTDWQKEVFSTGSNQNYQLSYSGGNEKSRYYVSGGYLHNKGIVRPATYDRYTLRLNLDNQVNNWFKIGTSINFINSKYHNTQDNASSGRGGVIMSALNTPPFLNVFKADGSGQFDPNPFQPSWENPVAYMEGPDEGTTDNRLIGNVTGEVKLLQGLTFKTNLGIDYTNHLYNFYLDPFRTVVGRDPSNHGLGRAEHSSTSAWLSENTLNYATSVGQHNFSVLAGMTVQESSWEYSYMEGKDFPDDSKIKTLNAANEITSGRTEESDWAIYSFLGRVTYDYEGKYLFTGTLRRDGSSRFSEGRQWGTFPSASIGWRLSAEPFMENVSIVDDLKLRAGWGKNGNQEGINNYASYTQYTFVRQAATGAGPSIVREPTLGNQAITWEETTQTNIGLDLSILSSRINFTFDAYFKETSGLLLDVELPDYSGYEYIRLNAGSMENKGLEFSISTVNVDKKFKWNTDFNISINRNKVKSLELNEVYYYAPIYSNNQQAIVMRPGLPLGTFFGYISEGVDPETGNIKYKDLNNNGTINEADRTIIGYAQPNFTYGMTNSFSFKNFNLSVFLQGSQGNDIFNATRVDLEGMFDHKNQSTDVLRRWEEEGDITDIPKATPGNVDNVRNSSRFVENGSYLRVKSISLTYNVNADLLRKIGISRLSLYATGQNLFTITDYSGFDPEVNAFGTIRSNSDPNGSVSKGTELGVDYGTYPQSKAVIFGMNVQF